jgi:hypothetical protein
MDDDLEEYWAAIRTISRPTTEDFIENLLKIAEESQPPQSEDPTPRCQVESSVINTNAQSSVGPNQILRVNTEGSFQFTEPSMGTSVGLANSTHTHHLTSNQLPEETRVEASSEVLMSDGGSLIVRSGTWVTSSISEAIEIQSEVHFLSERVNNLTARVDILEVENRELRDSLQVLEFNFRAPK